MEQRFDRLEDKLDALTKEIHVIAIAHEARVTKLETTQKGVIALCVAFITASMTALAKALHLA